MWPFLLKKYSTHINLVNFGSIFFNSGLLLLEVILLLSRIRNNKHNWFQLFSGSFIAASMSIASIFADNTLFENGRFDRIGKELTEEVNSTTEHVDVKSPSAINSILNKTDVI